MSFGGFTVIDSWPLLRVVLTLLALAVWIGIALHEL